jgi:hypothetical protein
MLEDVLKIGPDLRGRVVELVYTRDLKSLGFGLTGSSPVAPTTILSSVGTIAATACVTYAADNTDSGRSHAAALRCVKELLITFGYFEVASREHSPGWC